jgi:hypothetical protein
MAIPTGEPATGKEGATINGTDGIPLNEEPAVAGVVDCARVPLTTQAFENARSKVADATLPRK